MCKLREELSKNRIQIIKSKKINPNLIMKLRRRNLNIEEELIKIANKKRND